MIRRKPISCVDLESLDRQLTETSKVRKPVVYPRATLTDSELCKCFPSSVFRNHVARDLLQRELFTGMARLFQHRDEAQPLHAEER